MAALPKIKITTINALQHPSRLKYTHTHTQDHMVYTILQSAFFHSITCLSLTYFNINKYFLYPSTP